MLRIIFVFLILFFQEATSFSQTNPNFLRYGISAQVGTHIRKLSIWARPQILFSSTQFYGVADAAFCQRGLGNRRHFFQALLSAGFAQSFGKKYENYALPIRWATWQMQRELQLGYQINKYIDTRTTSQNTGQITVQYRRWQLSSDNDALAFSPHDRYRTGSIKLAFLDSNFAITQQLMVWTKDNKVPATSFQNHGILASSFYFRQSNRSLPMGLSVGWDDERIRDLFQNKLIHQSRFLRKLNVRVSQKVITKEKQKPRFVGQWSGNDVLQY